MKHEKMKKLTVLAMLSAIAYVAVALLRFPVVLFLSYEPKDVVIAIGGFLYGPLAALGISLVVSFIEMLTISSTGWIGFVMNFLSSAAFAGTAALLYRKKRTQGSAIAGLFGGALLMTVLMLLWNYLITPLYMHTARADVAAMLVPVFLPFNLLKGCLNATITVLLYKPVVQGLRHAHLLPPSKTPGRMPVNRRQYPDGITLTGYMAERYRSPKVKGVYSFQLGALAVLAVCIVLVLVLHGTI